MRSVCFLLIAGPMSLWAQSQGPLTQAVLARYNAIKQNMIESAEAMPADQYTFRLTPAQRTFAGWIDHTIMLNHNSCAAIKGGAALPMDHSKHNENQPKAELQKALKASYDFCDSALEGSTDAKLLGAVTADGKTAYPISAALGLIATSSSHYGNIVGYMRVKGITPPSTARQQKR